MTSSNDRIDRIEALLEQFIAASVADRQASNERMTRIEEATDATDARVDVLVTCVDTLAVDVRGLVDYLKNQSGNGRHGD